MKLAADSICQPCVCSDIYFRNRIGYIPVLSFWNRIDLLQCVQQRSSEVNERHQGRFSESKTRSK